MSAIEGHVTFDVGDVTFALAVADVQEILRSGVAPVVVLSGRELHGRPLALVDARGRTVPVMDLRTDPDAPADVIVPFDRTTTGVLVDHVRAVVGPGALLVEADVPAALPSYALGVLRPAGGGAPVLLLSLPAVPPDWEVWAAEHEQNEVAFGAPVDLETEPIAQDAAQDLLAPVG